jgi:hypothetical protein
MSQWDRNPPMPGDERSRMMESMVHTGTASHRHGLAPSLHDRKASVERAAREGLAAPEAAAGLGQRLLPRGPHALGCLFRLVGPGEVGEGGIWSDGQAVRRLDTPHPRGSQSVCGRLALERVVYGRREGPQSAYGPCATP